MPPIKSKPQVQRVNVKKSGKFYHKAKTISAKWNMMHLKVRVSKFAKHK